jgi:hypothetical protein
MLSRIPLITGLIASLFLAGTQQAQAADGGDVAIGVAAGALLGSVLAPRPVVVYERPEVYYAPPPPAIYYSAPVYVERPRVYYGPGPMYYVPGPPHHKHWRKHHRHHHHGYRW